MQEDIDDSGDSEHGLTARGPAWEMFYLYTVHHAPKRTPNQIPNNHPYPIAKFCIHSLGCSIWRTDMPRVWNRRSTEEAKCDTG